MGHHLVWDHQGAFDELHDAQHSALHVAILRTAGQLQSAVRQLQSLGFVASGAGLFFGTKMLDFTEDGAPSR